MLKWIQKQRMTKGPSLRINIRTEKLVYVLEEANDLVRVFFDKETARAFLERTSELRPRGDSPDAAEYRKLLKDFDDALNEEGDAFGWNNDEYTLIAVMGVGSIKEGRSRSPRSR